MAGSAPEFAWADNVVKCELARTRAGEKASEEKVFEEYVKLAGRVVNGGLQKKEEAPIDAPVKGKRVVKAEG